MIVSDPQTLVLRKNLVLPAGHQYRFVIHDRDSFFSRELDRQVAHVGVRVLRTPVRAPRANAVCERLGDSLRRECLDFLIPFNERHLKMTVKRWATHYNRGRPHSSTTAGPAHMDGWPPRRYHLTSSCLNGFWLRTGIANCVTPLPGQNS